MKINKDNFGWIFTSALLAFLLAMSIYMGISGFYFKTQPSYTTDLVLGKNIQIDVSKNMSNAVSFNLDGSYLSGERLPQIISIKNTEEEDGVYLRAKIYIYTSENKTLNMGLVETVNWTYNQEDGYYYFNDVLSKQDKVSLCSHVFVDEETSLQSNIKYIVTIVIEALDENVEIQNIWKANNIKIN